MDRTHHSSSEYNVNVVDIDQNFEKGRDIDQNFEKRINMGNFCQILGVRIRKLALRADNSVIPLLYPFPTGVNVLKMPL